MAGGDIFIGQILLVPFNFAPTGFAFCSGQLLPISQNTALFSLLGTTYGGDGKSTFALPNLQGRVPMGFGQGPGLTNREQGESLGSETSTLAATQMPAHTHAISTAALTAAARCRNGAGSQSTPVGNVPAIEAPAAAATYGNAAPDANMRSGAIVVGGGATAASAGGGVPHGNLAPYLTLNYVIALQGIFPSRP